MSVQEILANSLGMYMTSLCNDLYGKTYSDEFEYDLYSFLIEDGLGRFKGTFGTEDYQEKVLAQLKKLSEGCEGWMRFSPLSNEMEYVPMEEWLTMYEEHTTKNTEET